MWFQLLSGVLLQGSSGPPQVPATGELALQVAAAVEAAASAVDSAWPGYWPSNRSYAVFPFRTGSLVISAEAVGAAGVLLADNELPPPLRGRAYAVADAPGGGVLPWFTFDFRVGDRALFAASLLGPMPPFPDSLGASLFFLLHEGFHQHQLRIFASTIPEPAGTRLPADRRPAVMGRTAGIADSVVQAYLAAERAALRDAVLAPTKEERRSALRRYYEVRDARLLLLPSNYLVGETFGERSEGIATYVAKRGTAAALGLGAAGLRDAILSGLDRPYWPEYTVERQFGHWHVYAVGAAKAWLLEAHHPGWRDAVREGASLDRLLVNTLDGER